MAGLVAAPAVAVSIAEVTARTVAG